MNADELRQYYEGFRDGYFDAAENAIYGVLEFVEEQLNDEQFEKLKKSLDGWFDRRRERRKMRNL